MTTEVIFSVVLSVTLLAVLILTVHLYQKGRKLLVLAFFAFAVACSLLSTVYWLVYDLLRAGTRMPFAANEICEWALFLLLAAALRAAFSELRMRWSLLIPTVLFTAANAALWIAWSGEWVQDILTGLSLGYFLCVLVCCLWQSGAFSRGEWFGLGVTAVLLIAAQALTFFLPAAISKVLDISCSVLLLVVDAGLIIKSILSAKKNDSGKSLSLSFAVFAWSTVAMYMSSGWAYLAAMLLATLSYPLMLWALKKEVDAA